MTEYLTKAAFGRRHGRAPSTVSRWIKTGKLTPPALRPDGLVNAQMGDRQLGLRLDVTRGRPTTTLLQQPAARFPAMQRAQTQLLAARALNATISAERARRQLNAERGRYVLADEVYAVFGRMLADHIADVETSLTDLAIDLDLDREKLALLRRWWRTRRERTAEAARTLRDTNPRYVEDPRHEDGPF
jgi:hypothetical protein